MSVAHLPANDRMILIPGAMAGLAIFSGGPDSLFGNALSCLMLSGYLIFLLCTTYPATGFFHRIRLPFTLLFAAFFWLGWASFTGFTPDLAVSGLLGVAASIIALLCGAILGAHGIRLSRFTDIFLLVASVAAIWACLLLIIDPDGALGLGEVLRRGRFLGTLGNANVAAAIYVMTTIFAASALLHDYQKSHIQNVNVRRIGYSIALVIACSSVMATASRTGILIGVQALVALLLYFLKQNKFSSITFKTVAFVMLAIGFMFVIVSPDLLVERFQQIGAGTVNRQSIWSHYWTIAWSEPLFGFGSGSFAAVNSFHHGALQQIQEMWMVNSPHNLIISLLLSGGLPYLIFVSFAAFVILLAILNDALLRQWSVVHVGVALAILALLGCAMVDIILDIAAFSALLLFLVGLLWGRTFILGRIKS